MEQTISNYSLLRLLGRGGMGSVYEARHTTIERRAAIKILHREFCEDPDVLKRFMNEARAVNIIGHPGLVSVSEFGQTAEGAPYIVMEYIEGITLRERLQRAGGRLPAEQVVRLSRQIASTLAAAHSKQIVHRDLKPVNIMLVTGDPDGPEGEAGALDRVKVLDFGIAKLATETSSQTKSGILMGTPTYMSPEQCRSGRSAVDRSDVYALGIIMYEMLAGEPPFRGGPAVLMAAHLLQEPAPLSSLSPGTPTELCALIHRMLAKSPSDRPSAAEVARSLSAPSGQLTPPPLLSPASGPSLPVGQPLSEEATVLKPARSPSVAPSAGSRAAVPLPLSGRLLGITALLVLLLGLCVGLLALGLGRARAPAPYTPAADAAVASPSKSAPSADGAPRPAGTVPRPPTPSTPPAASRAAAAPHPAEPSGGTRHTRTQPKTQSKGAGKIGSGATKKAGPHRSPR